MRVHEEAAAITFKIVRNQMTHPASNNDWGSANK